MDNRCMPFVIIGGFFGLTKNGRMMFFGFARYLSEMMMIAIVVFKQLGHLRPS